MAKGHKPKKSPAPNPPKPKEAPRNKPGLPGASNSDERICWRFEHMDHDGPWGFNGLGDAGWRSLMTCLASFESMTMHEAFAMGGPGKDYDIDLIPTARARERLEVLGFGDQTKISRFQLAGKPRLYGFRVGHVFHAVFWDPEHQIWPSQKKHT
jgi:hypothetical protein